MVVNTITSRLAQIGLSDYEARAYVALLIKNPASAYEIAKNSGIPTSTIYEVLSRLSEKKVVSTLGEYGARKYMPLEPDELLAGFRNGMETNLKALGEELSQLSKGTAVSYIWNILDHKYLVEK